MQFALKMLFFACAVAPVLGAVGHGARRVPFAVLVVGWTLFLILGGAQFDPLAFGMRQVDDALLGGFCAAGLPPSR